MGQEEVPGHVEAGGDGRAEQEGGGLEHAGAEAASINLRKNLDGTRRDAFAKVVDFRLALTARAGGVHLGDGGNEGAVYTPVTLDRVVREKAAGAQLGDAPRQRVDTGGEAVLPVAIRLFAQPPHSWSASASITAFTTYSASLRSSFCIYRWRRRRNGAWRACPASGLIRFP